MAVDSVFKCERNEMDYILNEISERLNASYEEANKNAFKMAMLSKTLKEQRNKKYCVVPFCHTVEAEAFGSTVKFDQTAGNRISKFYINEIDSIEKIKPINLKKGRISEVLTSIKMLK